MLALLKTKKELEGENQSCRESRRAHGVSSRWHRLRERATSGEKLKGRAGNWKNF